ncbi:unnamed protein product [Chrysoparadoxa australica]
MGVVREFKPLRQRSWRLDVWPLMFGHVLLQLVLGFSRPLLLVHLPLVALQVLALLCTQWSVAFRSKVAFAKASVEEASHVWVVPAPNSGPDEIVPLCRQQRGTERKLSSVMLAGQSFAFPSCWIEFQQAMYVFGEAGGEKKGFTSLEYPTGCAFKEYASAKGHTGQSAAISQGCWGVNALHIPLPSFLELFHEHAVAPFFVFQVLCVGLWSLDEYWYYAVFTLLMLVLFECTVCKQRQRSLEMLRAMRRPPHAVYVLRDSTWQLQSTEDLVPGDVVSLVTRPQSLANLLMERRRQAGGGRWREASGFDSSWMEEEDLAVPCDLLLLRGSCVVNEAMLTGESLPQVKESSLKQAQDTTLLLEDGPGSAHSRHVIFSGTKVLQHSYSQAEGEAGGAQVPRPPDHGCLGFVLRTGFETSQGQLMKSILYASERVTAGSGTEACMFIGILLLFALGAAGYVLHEGLGNPDRDRYKLILHCIMIVTSVVPPELPMELSLAVTNSLAALQHRLIYCTEPFRIPLAGKVDFCCFDKTGTLTSDNLVLKGVVAPPDAAKEASKASAPSSSEEAVVKLRKPSKLPPATTRILAGCQSLVNLQGSLAGDPLERAALEGICWQLRRDGTVHPPPGAAALPVKVLHSFVFDARLRRMSAVVTGELKGTVWVVTKGAPEALEELLEDRPPHYRATYLYHMGRGRRVLALGYRELSASAATPQRLRQMERADTESRLKFAGFMVVSCPIKPDTEYVLRELRGSGHAAVMITGDGALTAADVARQVSMIKTPPEKTLLLANVSEQGLGWSRLVAEEGGGKAGNGNGNGNKQRLVAPLAESRSLSREHTLCVTGEKLQELVQGDSGVGAEALHVLGQLCPFVSIFARVSPSQKELIIAALNKQGHTTLMCGDGTNDVAALKRAHVGVSIVNSPELEKRLQKHADSLGKQGGSGSGSSSLQSKRANTLAMAELQEAHDDPSLVQLGDASIASPFTTKTTSVNSVLSIVRQGRCTLVTTQQVYKILALNCLTSAYMLSSLYLWGVKQGDVQMTIMGLALAAFFFFISRAQPLQRLSSERPPKRIFCAAVLLPVVAQFAVHMTCLLIMVGMCEAHVDKDDPSLAPDGDFQPNVFNTAVFLLSSVMQVTTFAANYTGHPFVQSLKDNRPLYYMIVIAYAVLFTAATDVFEPINDLLELAPAPDSLFRAQFVGLMASDTIAAWIMAHLAKWVTNKWYAST